MEANYQQSLFALLDKKKGYYLAILEISDEEHRKLQAKCALNHIIKLMKKKKILLSCIDECDEKIAPLKEVWAKDKHSCEQLALSIKKKLNELDELIRKIIALDDSNRKLFEELICNISEV